MVQGTIGASSLECTRHANVSPRLKTPLYLKLKPASSFFFLIDEKNYITIKYTVVLSLYSEEATVGNPSPFLSADSNLKRSSISEVVFTEADRPKRTCCKS